MYRIDSVLLITLNDMKRNLLELRRDKGDLDGEIKFRLEQIDSLKNIIKEKGTEYEFSKNFSR
jgi:hypothetical protein